MKALDSIALAITICCAPLLSAAETAVQIDLKRGVPADAHLAVYGSHNPEREYQFQYYEAICQAIKDERLGERFLEIITSRLPADQLAKAEEVLGEINEAIAPINWDTFSECQEVVYAQQMFAPFNHHLVLIRLPSDGAAQWEAAGKNLFALAEKYSGGKLPHRSYEEGAANVAALQGIPQEFPFSPVVARIDDIFLFSTSPQLAEESLELLQSDSGTSLFDEPRLQAALQELPEAEDSITVFDGKRLFSQLRTIGDFIREKGGENNPDDPKIERVASLVELLIDELSVPDFEVAVEYTEGYANHVVTSGQIVEGSEETLLGTLLVGGEPFSDWQSWIPDSAVAYSLNTGVRLQPFYQRLMSLVREHIPESQEPLDKFEQIQERIGVHLDRDILQSFSGEFVSITLPGTSPTGESSHQSVLALKCQAPERIEELLHMAVDRLNEFPAVQAQQLSWEPCEELAEFERLNAAIFAMFGAEPVVGFRDGWMIIGSHPSAVQQVLDVRTGKSPSITTSEHFQRFGLEIDGPVSALNYANLAENTRHAAQVIRQIGTVAPMIIGMVGAQADPEDLKPIQEILALLPSVANVVEKFDFMEESLTVVKPGELPTSYTKHGVILIRPPGEKDTPEAE